MLVDFDARDDDDDIDNESEESDSSHEPDEPKVEWTDEFGRTRLIPRSEIPRGAPGVEAETSEK